VVVANRVARCCSAVCWLSLVGDSSAAGDGLLSAWMRLRAAAVARSVEDAVGIETWEGNHARVSTTLSALVSVIQIW
jgi:hypothetical protein